MSINLDYGEEVDNWITTDGQYYSSLGITYTIVNTFTENNFKIRISHIQGPASLSSHYRKYFFYTYSSTGIIISITSQLQDTQSA